MIGVVVATQGSLGKALLETAHAVVLSATNVETVVVDSGDDTKNAGKRLLAAVERARLPGGVLVLTDTFGDAPSNLAVALHRAGEIEVVTGTNLPMIIKALQIAGKDIDLTTAARQIKEEGQRAIVVTGEVLGVAPVGGAR